MSMDEDADRTAPFASRLSAIHLASTDLTRSRTFYCEIIGGDLVTDDGTELRVHFGDIDIVLARQRGCGTPFGREYPHYAFTVTPEQFLGLKRRLDAYGVPTNEPWTRKNRPYALMYFRDPDGNQFELFAPDGCSALPLRLGKRAGGDYETDFTALTYSVIGPTSEASRTMPARPTGLNHFTAPVGDFAEGRRFLISVLGGIVTYDASAHVTTLIGGKDVGVAPQAEGWPAPDALLPFYTLEVDAANLLALHDHIASFEVPTSGFVSTNGINAMLFFRDPSGNLWQGLCPSGFTSDRIYLLPDLSDLDVRGLCYERWRDPVIEAVTTQLGA